MMKREMSGYLRFLPPVLWENEREDADFSLGTVLRVFEKILTGIADDVTVEHEAQKGTDKEPHAHVPIEEQIAGLDRHFDPWKTPESFLPWLASWVALEFPTLQGQQLWDEYQRRKVTSEIARIYRLRGLKAGLSTYVELYAVGRVRPRVALDDGNRVLTVTPRAAGLAPTTALVTQGPVLTADGRALWSEGLLRPWCVAAGSDGSVFLGDAGTPSDVAGPVQKSRVWRISPEGYYDMAGAPAKPQPVSPDTQFARVAAIAVRPPLDGRPETLYILDRPGRLYASPAPYVSADLVTTLAGDIPVWPVAMCVDGNGDLLILDRGRGAPATAAPKIITVRSNAPAPSSPVRTPLRGVREPMSLVVRADGNLIVGDGGDQKLDGGGQPPSNLVRIDRSTSPEWTETPLLPPVNPLVAPTGLAWGDDGRLYVLDAGLNPFSPPAGDPFVLSTAEAAVVHCVDLTLAQPVVRRITVPGQFVCPVGMTAAQGGRLVICDPGFHEVANLQPFWSRVGPFRIAIVIHFSATHLPAGLEDRKNAMKQAAGNIRTVVEQHKPAHTIANLVTFV
ncbi:phage tail protein [Streptomyces sp. NPDC005355]|uniref:phage tail protein n=1 Tax=Streptomyces sp. NPDC005355 TaxID=3157038 RepID=UPI0033A7F6EC